MPTASPDPPGCVTWAVLVVLTAAVLVAMGWWFVSLMENCCPPAE